MMDEEMDEDAEMVRKAVFEIIANQMRDNDPPITNATYARLRAEGHSHEDAMKYIGCVVTTEIVEVMNGQGEFNLERYTTHLEGLPALPWDK